MNKKILFLILAVTIALPLVSSAINSPDKMAAQIEKYAMTIGGSVIVIGWVITGILYLLAAGSPEKLGTAKKALIATVIGTVIVIIGNTGYEMIKNFLAPILW